MTMFWCETLKDDNKYCICNASWKTMKIIHDNAIKNFVEVYMTAEDGSKCLVHRTKRGSAPTSHELSFSPWQHVKIEVLGGTVTVVGTCEIDARKHIASNNFIIGCPFDSFDDNEARVERAVEIRIHEDTKSFEGEGARKLNKDISNLKLNQI